MYELMSLIHKMTDDRREKFFLRVLRDFRYDPSIEILCQSIDARKKEIPVTIRLQHGRDNILYAAANYLYDKTLDHMFSYDTIETVLNHIYKNKIEYERPRARSLSGRYGTIDDMEEIKRLDYISIWMSYAKRRIINKPKEAL